MSEDNNSKYIGVGVWLALGSGIETAIGAATQNIGMWLAIGAGIGVVGAAISAPGPGEMTTHEKYVEPEEARDMARVIGVGGTSSSPKIRTSFMHGIPSILALRRTTVPVYYL